jgi:hypothetical protein
MPLYLRIEPDGRRYIQYGTRGAKYYYITPGGSPEVEGTFFWAVSHAQKQARAIHAHANARPKKSML